MLKPPPLFDFGSTTDWYAVANNIANAINDAKTLDEVERVKEENRDNLRALTINRRDLAVVLSAGFADRRNQLGGR